FEKRDLLFCEGLHHQAPKPDHTDWDTLSHQWSGNQGSITQLDSPAFGIIRLDLLKVMSVNRFTVHHRSPRMPVAIQRRLRANWDRRSQSIGSDFSKESTFHLHKNTRVRRVAQPCGIFRNRIKHWLNIRRRTSDDAQNLTRRRLLLQ